MLVLHVDDVLIHACNQKEHDNALKIMFKRLREEGVIDEGETKSIFKVKIS